MHENDQKNIFDQNNQIEYLTLLLDQKGDKHGTILQFNKIADQQRLIVHLHEQDLLFRA